MAATMRCDQCGRTGTDGFRTFPEQDGEFEGRVIVPANSLTECTDRAACRKRWPKPPMDEAGV